QAQGLNSHLIRKTRLPCILPFTLLPWSPASLYSTPRPPHPFLHPAFTSFHNPSPSPGRRDISTSAPRRISLPKGIRLPILRPGWPDVFISSKAVVARTALSSKFLNKSATARA